MDARYPGLLRAWTRIHRRHHHELLTFSMMYEYSEHFIMPLSHDEVVHGKGTLLAKMPGDEWQRFANLRALLAYQYTRPGQAAALHGQRARLPAGVEPRQQPRLASRERAAARGAAAIPGRPRRRLSRPLRAVARGSRARGVQLARRRRPGPFDLLVFPPRRRSDRGRAPQPHAGATAGLPEWGARGRALSMLLSSDDPKYGGGGFGVVSEVGPSSVAWQNQPASFLIGLPPLGAVMLAHDPVVPDLSPPVSDASLERGALPRPTAAPGSRCGHRRPRGGGHGAPRRTEQSRIPLAAGADGVHTGSVRRALPGTDYGYRLDGGPDRPDPVSRWRPKGVHGPSRIVDPAAFQWSDGAWRASRRPIS